MGSARLAAAERLIALGRSDAAVALLEQVQPHDADFEGASLSLAAMARAQGAGDKILAAIWPLIAWMPDHSGALAYLALVGEVGQSPWTWHQRAIALAPHDAWLWLNHAVHALRRGQSGIAVQSFWICLALDPARAEAWAGLGFHAAGRGDHGLAIRVLERAERLSPDAPAPPFLCGASLQALNRQDSAEDAYARAAVKLWRARGSMPASMPATPRLGIGWKPDFESGWGVYGANLVQRLTTRGAIQPVIINPVIAGEDGSKTFAELFHASLPIVAEDLAQGRAHDFPCLIALGNDMSRHPALGRSRREIGVIFLEDTRLSAQGLARGHDFELLIAGATWGTQVLNQMGFSAVKTVLQGVNTDLFHPRDRTRDGGAQDFRIFTGGKLEFRKAQDLVIAAFKRFHARHPDARLVVAWQSPWPMVARTITLGGMVSSAPMIGAGNRLDLGAWLAREGINLDAVEILDLVPNHAMPAILNGVDCALFPNRCEGGTNLVAMEAMAMGVPTILSANSGHLDLIAEDTCIPLLRQAPVQASVPWGMDGWGTSDLDEIDQALEHVYQNRDAARATGLNGAAFLAQWSWPTQIDRLIEAIGL